MSESGFIDTPSGSGLNPCSVCDNPTQSHGLAVRQDDTGGYEPTTLENAEFVFPVCHTCYSEYDGDAEAVCTTITDNQTQAAYETLGISANEFQTAMTAAQEVAGEPQDGYVGESVVFDFVTEELTAGDVVRINGGSETWAIVPADEEKINEVEGEVICPMIEVNPPSGEGKGGGLLHSENPLEDVIYIAYAEEGAEGINFEPVEQIDLLGHAEEVEQIER